MSAPERIFCHPTERQPVPSNEKSNAKWLRGKWKDHDSGASGDVGYIRADLVDSAAIREAALREAAASVQAGYSPWETQQRILALIDKKGTKE